ncbi:MAG: ATP-dependent nuclease [Planctomycetales bacterium]
MPRIRAIAIENFRGIKSFDWVPSPGINCLIGPGDSGKSSILDAIDYCLGARRNIQFSDADFYKLDVSAPISISVTIGDLYDRMKSLDAYGLYLRSFDAQTGAIEDEPEKDMETVLTIRLRVEGDLEPSWTLVSERGEAQGQTRSLSWTDRTRLAPTRIGAMAGYHLAWSRGSVLNRLSDERADASAELAKAARDARIGFGEAAKDQLAETLDIVAQTANNLGIPVGAETKALLDAHSVTFTGGTIALHDNDGIPLRGLGVGSTRLLIAGLQRRAASEATVVLIDELEHGLEPHRIVRFLGSLGAKEPDPPLQVFMSTHSPVVLQELSGDQLFVVRPNADQHDVLSVGTSDTAQGAIRSYPEAFLAPSVIICEGASEVGLVRGLDQFRVSQGESSISALGAVPIDSRGGGADRPFERASAFRTLGYRTSVIRDDDKPPTQSVEAGFVSEGGVVTAWRAGRALEDELFLSLTDDAVEKLINRAIELHGEELVAEHIKSVSGNAANLSDIQLETLIDGKFSQATRTTLGKAARTKSNSWFKSVTKMEDVARDIVGPDLEHADAGFRDLITDFFAWVGNG